MRDATQTKRDFGSGKAFYRREAASASSTRVDPKTTSNVSAHSRTRVRNGAASLFGAVDRRRQGMGMRSWRYSMLVEDGVIKKLFVEPDIRDNPTGVGVEFSDADTMLAYLENSR